MKGTIIGTDLLEKDGSVKILEINTNTTIYNEGAYLLDYDVFFNVLTENNITELHFIWTEGDAFTPLNELFVFEDKLKEKCVELGITYTAHKVPQNSVTIPYIEDAEHKFILRQSFDTTAIVDELYCADKFNFFDLMKDTEFIPKTYFTNPELSMDTIDTIDYTNGDEPNILKKYRFPTYDGQVLPTLYSILDETELVNIKTETDTESNILLQEFVYDENNIVDGRYNIIRSIDIIYGSNLDVINMGGYKQSTMIPLSFATTELVTGTRKLSQKSRYKYITKELGNFAKVDYHVDDDTSILSYDGTLKDVDTIQLGDYIKSIDFRDLNGTSPSHDRNIEVFGWDSTIQQTQDTLVDVQTSLSGITSANVDTLFIRITLENGLTWTDAPSCTYYIEELNSTSTKFEKVNKLYVGDKLIIIDKDTNELSTMAITGLEMEYAIKTIYALDFEPSDLFLVDVGDGLFGIMHNSCWCPWNYCGHYCHSSYCPGCGGGGGGFSKV
jgi:hypothetical protein